MAIKLLVLVLMVTVTFQLSLSTKIVLRSKRQIEREGVFNDSVVILDKDGNRTTGVEYELPEESKPNDTDVMEVDFDRNDGTFSFGGRFPSLFPVAHDNFHDVFGQLFQQMVNRFEEMSKRMQENFNLPECKDLPSNYNNTKEEIVTIGGQQYVKKMHVIKKGTNNSNILVTSVSYEPVDATSNEN